MFTMYFLAYIDPGSGSLVFQLVLAWLMGMLFVFRRVLVAPFAFIKSIFKRNQQPDE